MEREVYLDNAATTPVDKAVLEAMLPYFSQRFYNPASPHLLGQAVNQEVEKVRAKIAGYLGIEPQGVIFTSGATESNNLAVKGLYKAAYKAARQRKELAGKKLHYITTSIEHPCVRESFRTIVIEAGDKTEVTFLKVDSEGLVTPAVLKESIQPTTVLVSIIFVNNEIGTVQDIKALQAVIEEERQKRGEGGWPIYLHIDASQAPAYFDCSRGVLGWDLITLSGHKIYGPKGIGILAKREGVLLENILSGGGQENHLRSGTLNVPGIIGVGEALELAQERRAADYKYLQELKDYFTQRILTEVKGAIINGPQTKEHGSPAIINISFEGIEGESALLLLSQAGISVSTGSACSAKDLKTSPVQEAIGNPPLRAHSSLRFSLSRTTTKEDLDYAVEKLKEVIEKLRQMSRAVAIEE